VIRNPITAVAIALVSLGVISGLLILFDYLESPHMISKEQAMAIVMKSGRWTQQELDNNTIDAKLLQAKLSNGVALVIDPKTMSDEPYAVPLRAGYVHENQLFWEVAIKKHLRGMEYVQWRYEIDATNGTLLESHTPYG